MSVKIREIIDALDHFAPLPLQESFDNAGLQCGLTETEVSGVLLCLDVTPSIVEEAVEKGCNLIVSHHPLIFHALKHITGSNPVERAVMLAIENHVTVVSMHTNMDAAWGGVNFKIAEKLGLKDVRLFNTRTVEGAEGGEGAIGTLPEPMEAKAFIQMTKKALEAQTASCNELLLRPVKTVAICGGAGAFLAASALKEGADAFITGEMRYHEYAGMEQQMQLVVLGHYETEHFTPEIFQSIINEHFPQVKAIITEQSTNPIVYL